MICPRTHSLPSSRVHALLQGSHPSRNNLQRLQSHITTYGRHSDCMSQKNPQKTSGLIYSVIEKRKRFSSEEKKNSFSTESLQVLEHWRTQWVIRTTVYLNNFYQIFKELYDPKQVDLKKNLLKNTTDKTQLAFIHTAYVNYRTIPFQTNLKNKTKNKPMYIRSLKTTLHLGSGSDAFSLVLPFSLCF